MMQELRKPESSTGGLSIHQQVKNGNYELLIFSIPWKNDVPYTPLIIDKATGRIVGVMLPFNELHLYLSDREARTISELGTIWTTFVIRYRFTQ